MELPDIERQRRARQRYLSRAEAAEYIKQNWFEYSPRTLAKLAVIGGGPAFRKVGKRTVVYSPDDIDSWAESKIGPKVSSTSELTAA